MNQRTFYPGGVAVFDQPFVRPCPLQAIDPRFRVALAALCALCLALLQTLPACLAGLALGSILLLLARPPVRPLLRRLGTVNVFVAFLWCVTPWTTPGEVIASWGFLHFTVQGLQLTLLVSLKANAIVCIFLALVATLDVPATGHALEKLHCPRKLVFLFLFTGRYVHVLGAEWQNLMVAARLRAFRPRSNMHTYRTLASLLGLLLVRSHERAVRVHEAMLLRGFTGHFHSVVSFKARPVDYFFGLGLLLSLGSIILLEVGSPFHV